MEDLIAYADNKDKNNKGVKKWAKNCHRHMIQERDQLSTKNG